MEPRDFVTWLRGFLTASPNPTPEQLTVIKAALEKCTAYAPYTTQLQPYAFNAAQNLLLVK